MTQEIVTQKLSWRLAELPPATGLSLAFWRKVVRTGRLRSRKVCGAVIVLDADLQEFLAGDPQKNTEAQIQVESLATIA